MLDDNAQQNEPSHITCSSTAGKHCHSMAKAHEDFLYLTCKHSQAQPVVGKPALLDAQPRCLRMSNLAWIDSPSLLAAVP